MGNYPRGPVPPLEMSVMRTKPRNIAPDLGLPGIDKHVDGITAAWSRAFEGDAEAARSLVVKLPNDRRGYVAKKAWLLKMPVPAFRELFGSVWGHDHRFLTCYPRSVLKRMFAYAQFSPPAFPETFRIWRGGFGQSCAQLKRGLSWTVNREVACFFAMRLSQIYPDKGPPLVISAMCQSDDVIYLGNSRHEDEVVCFAPRDVCVDGDAEDWRPACENFIARMQEVQKKVMEENML